MNSFTEAFLIKTNQLLLVVLVWMTILLLLFDSECTLSWSPSGRGEIWGEFTVLVTKWQG